MCPILPLCPPTMTPVECVLYSMLQDKDEFSLSLITHKVHPVLGQPVEALEEEQEGEEGDKARGEVVPEHGECQARLGHRVPRALNEMLEGGEEWRDVPLW